MFLQELLTLAMSKAEEYHIHLVEGHLVCELQISITYQSLVNITNRVAGIALTIGKDNLCLGMIQQEANQLTSRITCSTKDTYFNALHWDVPDNMHEVLLKLP